MSSSRDLVLVPGVDDPADNPHAPVMFVVHDAAGKILRAGRCARGTLDLQHGPGDLVAEVDRFYHPERHAIDVAANAIVARSFETAARAASSG